MDFFVFLFRNLRIKTFTEKPLMQYFNWIEASLEAIKSPGNKRYFLLLHNEDIIEFQAQGEML